MDFETLAWGYGLVEGPRVDADDTLYFSDLRYGGIYRRTPAGDVSTVVPERRNVGGIALHADGGLVISGPDVRHVREGEARVLFARDGITSFNDLFTDREGRVYAGTVRSDPFHPPEPWVPGDFWRITGAGTADLLYGDVQLTNGIGFSPDGRWLYHSDTIARHIIAHPLDDDGTLGARTIFAEVDSGYPDGLAVDEEGAVWVASFLGDCLLRYTPDGTLDRRVPVPASRVASLCFGGADRKDLYVTTADNADVPERKGTIFRGRSDVAGLPAPPARI